LAPSRKIESPCYQAGSQYADILEAYNCTFVAIHPTQYDEYLGYANWFYQTSSFPALQCVWPDKQGRFPWQAGFPTGLARLQPVLSEPEGLDLIHEP
jgi:hypothetical protein